MVFVVRVRNPAGMHRLVFTSCGASWSDLQLQVQDVLHVNIDQQLISRTPLHQPNYIELPANTTLEKAKINNGDILYMAAGTGSITSSAPPSTPSTPAPALTSRCTHGPNGACAHCRGVEPGQENKIKGKCNHGANATCIHCSETVKSESKDLPVWLCNHPDTAFCSKCLPPESEEEKQHPKPLSCTCDKSKGQECTRCIVTRPTIKVDKIPFARFLGEKRALCQFKHTSSTTCINCTPPQLPSFTGLKNCDKGHHPWPLGVCLSCAPPNATLREQTYRHCDSISVQPNILQEFYKSWMQKGSSFQRAAILFGRYMDEPAETNNPGAIRAQVQAYYEPPQENGVNFIRFLKDPNEKLVHQLAAQLGIEVVGWVVTTQKRSGEKYGGDVLMSGEELRQAARFQNRYKNEYGYSRFVTIIMEHGEQVEPRAYQVADLAVCLERDGVFGKCADSNMLCTRVPGPNEMTPTVVYKDRPLQPGKEFLPDELIVKVILSVPKQADVIFAHVEFPCNGNVALIKAFLTKYAREEYQTKLSDFNLLIALANQIPINLVLEVCEAIRDKKSLKNETKSALDVALLSKNLL